MMDFSKKLSLLTQVFKISNSKLARAIDVDASLISRWKTGDRSLKADSRHLAALASHFVQMRAYPYQKHYLDQLLTSIQPDTPSLSENEKIHLLADWLVQPDQQLPAQLQPDKKPALADKPEKLLKSISNWLEKGHPTDAGKGLAGQMPPQTDLSFAFQKSRQLKDEFYTGLAGKRQAILNFLLEVLSQPRPAELLLLSEENMDWLVSDPAFLASWAGLLEQIIRLGHKITIIHIVNRRTDEISKVFEYWLPLHLSGQIDSFYLPRYLDPVINQTIFILRGQAVCLAQSTKDPLTRGLTFLSREEAVINHYTAIYESILRECQAFFSIYTPQNIKTMNEYSRLHHSSGPQYVLRHQPDIKLLPAEVQKKLLPLTYPDQPLYLEKSGQQQIVYDMMPLQFVDKIQHTPILLQSDCQLFLKKPYQLSLAASRAWLNNIIWQLKEKSNYNLFLYQTPVSQQPLAFNLNYFSNQAAYFAAKTSQDPFIIALREANSLHSLGLFLENFIARIPSSQRKRRDVLARLEQAAEKLTENIN